MTQPLKHLMFAMFATLALACAAQAADEISPQDFVDQTSGAGIAKVAAGKLALEKSDHPKVVAFARKMVDDNTWAAEQLRLLATQEGLELADDATLTDKAKAKILAMRDAASFDKAYANNQVVVNRKTVSLLHRAANSDDEGLRTFATRLLPMFEYHLRLAENLAVDVGATK